MFLFGFMMLNIKWIFIYIMNRWSLKKVHNIWGSLELKFENP